TPGRTADGGVTPGDGVAVTGQPQGDLSADPPRNSSDQCPMLFHRSPRCCLCRSEWCLVLRGQNIRHVATSGVSPGLLYRPYAITLSRGAVSGVEATSEQEQRGANHETAGKR